MKGFAHERLEDWENAVAAYDQAVGLDARNPAAWNARGLALLHLRRFDEARKSLDLALSIDPAYEPAIEAKRLCDDREAAAKVEAFARAVVQYERAVHRPASKEEIFKQCQVPLQLLDPVVEFVNEPAAVAIETLPPERIKRFEDESLALLRSTNGSGELRLADAMQALPGLDVSEAREVLGYLRQIESLHLEPDPSWQLDPLIRRALDLPKEEWNLARELSVGPYEAKKLEVSLRIFQGGGFRARVKPAQERAEKPHPARPAAHEVPPRAPETGGAEAPAMKPKVAPRPPETRPLEAPPKAPEPAPPAERPKKRDETDARDFSRL
jgi:tetratricopeptide (TPR) repeat protein